MTHAQLYYRKSVIPYRICIDFARFSCIDPSEQEMPSSKMSLALWNSTYFPELAGQLFIGTS